MQALVSVPAQCKQTPESGNTVPRNTVLKQFLRQSNGNAYLPIISALLHACEAVMVL